jgi:hypothetical protein
VKLLDNVEGSGRTVVLATARNIKDDVKGIEIYLNGKRVADAAKITEQTTKKDDLAFARWASRSSRARAQHGAVVAVGNLDIEGPPRT